MKKILLAGCCRLIARFPTIDGSVSVFQKIGVIKKCVGRPSILSDSSLSRSIKKRGGEGLSHLPARHLQEYKNSR